MVPSRMRLRRLALGSGKDSTLSRAVGVPAVRLRARRPLPVAASLDAEMTSDGAELPARPTGGRRAPAR